MPYNSYTPYYGYNYYQPSMAYQQPTQNTQNVQQATNDIIWVQGEAGAKAYLVAPNTTVTLWDSESPTIYLKTSDARGVPTMRILDFKERTVATQNSPFSTSSQNDSITPLKNEIDEIKAKYEAIEARLAEVENKASSRRKKEETE